VEDRHPLSVRFHELLGEAGELHDLKQLDYGLDADPFANVRATKDWGMPSWVGAMVRATDKVKRLQTYARKGGLANEPVIDAFMDLAVYALIGRVLYEEETHSGSPEETPETDTYRLACRYPGWRSSCKAGGRCRCAEDAER
jgi:hypothetical protein